MQLLSKGLEEKETNLDGFIHLYILTLIHCRPSGCEETGLVRDTLIFH